VSCVSHVMAPKERKKRGPAFADPLGSYYDRPNLALENSRQVSLDLFDRYDSLLHGQTETDQGTKHDYQGMDSDWITVHLKVPFYSFPSSRNCTTGPRVVNGGCPPRSPASGPILWAESGLFRQLPFDGQSPEPQSADA
jgi:hypothetical protein